MREPQTSTARPTTPPGVGNGFAADYRVRFDEAGPDGQIRTSTLLRYAQDVAWRHSEDRGFDRVWYADRGLSWIVRGVELDVLVLISMGAPLRVSTAVIGHRRIWARRLAEARLSEGELAARVVTDWVLLDVRGRPVRIPPDFGLQFVNPEAEGDIVRATPDDSGEAASLRLRVRPHELDPMGHVNNASYLDWLEEALLARGAGGPAPIAPVTGVPRSARLEYLVPAGPGDDVEVTTWLRDGQWNGRISRSDGATLVRGTGTP